MAERPASADGLQSKINQTLLNNFPSRSRPWLKQWSRSIRPWWKFFNQTLF